jgi:hypothetical protein
VDLEVEDVALERRARAAAVAVLEHERDAADVPARDRGAERAHRRLDVRVEIGVPATLRAGAVKRARLEELLRVHLARVERVVNRHLEELEHRVEPGDGGRERRR